MCKKLFFQEKCEIYTFKRNFLLFIQHRFVNLFLSDPRYLSSYFEAQFRPRAARSNEVILLVPNILNSGETLPVPLTYDQLFHFYMDIYARAFPETSDDNATQQSLQPPAPPSFQEQLYVFLNEYLSLNYSTMHCT